MPPLVTVGLPFYNARATLADAVRSVFAQTYPHWELLLVDDGSTDDSACIVEAISDPRVRLLRNTSNRGLVPCLNRIAAEAGGEYIARMDADDIMHSDRFRRQIDFLQSRPQVDVVGTEIYSLSPDGVVEGRRGVSVDGRSVRDVVCKGAFLHATILAKRDWCRSNPYDPGFLRAEDRELWSRAARHSTFASLPDALYFVREVEFISLAKYWTSARSLVKMLWRDGPAVAGYPRTVLLIAKEYGKCLLYLLASRVGSQAFFVRLRNRTISPEERDACAGEIERIRGVRVLGLRHET